MVQLSQGTCAVVAWVEVVGGQVAAQPVIERGSRFVDEARVERDQLEGSRRIAPQVAVDLAWLCEAQRAGGLDALATVDARDRATVAGEAHAVVRLHAAIELRGLPDAEVRDAGTDRSGPGSGEHAVIIPFASDPAWAFLADAKTAQDRCGGEAQARCMTQQITALVTGANKGIGRETARRLAGLGMTVLVGARDRGRGEAAVASLRTDSPDVHLVVLDVADEASVARAAADVTARFGRLDVLVNNAGIAIGSGPPSTQGIAALRALFATNVFGLVAVTQAFLPLLGRAPAARIVNVSTSLASLRLAADPDHRVAQQAVWFGYAASKTAVHAFTVRLANELRASNAKVNAACPGYVATDLNQHRGVRSVQQGAEIIVRLATLPDDGPTGGWFDDAGVVPW
ncbi:MAG: SDR family oxidoreductase [Kofleriaceae bacterium]